MDIGCTRGVILLFLQSIGCSNLFGIDLGPYMKERLRDPSLFEAHFGDLPPRITFYQVDVDTERLPFDNAALDLVIMTDVIEHLYYPDRVLEECRRTLRTGGVLFIRTPNAVDLKRRILTFNGRTAYPDLDAWLAPKVKLQKGVSDRRFHLHIREYTMGELELLLRYYGFKPILKKIPCPYCCNGI